MLWQPLRLDDEPTLERGDRWLRRLAIAAGIVAAVAVVLAIVLAAAAAETTPIAFVAASRVGEVLAIRLALALGIVAVATIRSPYRTLLGLTLVAAALATISLISHSAVATGNGSAATAATGAAIAFDWLHLSATAAWIGSLPALLIALLAVRNANQPQRRPALAHLVTRYTGLATASVAVLTATGLVAALSRMDTTWSLWTTAYGRALLVKLALFAALLALGAFNRWRHEPRLRSQDQPANALRRSVVVEIALSAVLLIAVGVLTASPPPQSLASQSSDRFEETARVGAASVSLQIVRTGLAGDVFAVTPRGLPAGVKPEVVLRLSMPSHGMPEAQVELQEVEPGRWGARSSQLSMAGPWSIETIVRAIGMNDVRHTFTFDTTPVTQTSTRATLPWWAIALVVAAIAAALSQLPLRSRLQHRFQLAGVLVVLATFVGTIVLSFVQPVTAGTNPLQPTAQVLASGKTIYEQNCVSCHGVGGRGDGPAARTLPGLPADFTLPHFASHDDASLFGWVRGGKPGTAMPGFAQLNDQQIWEVITYIRQIYADANQSATR